MYTKFAKFLCFQLKQWTFRKQKATATITTTLPNTTPCRLSLYWWATAPLMFDFFFCCAHWEKIRSAVVVVGAPYLILFLLLCSKKVFSLCLRACFNIKKKILFLCRMPTAARDVDNNIHSVNCKKFAIPTFREVSFIYCCIVRDVAFLYPILTITWLFLLLCSHRLSINALLQLTFVQILLNSCCEQLFNMQV